MLDVFDAADRRIDPPPPDTIVSEPVRERPDMVRFYANDRNGRLAIELRVPGAVAGLVDVTRMYELLEESRRPQLRLVR